MLFRKARFVFLSWNRINYFRLTLRRIMLGNVLLSSTSKRKLRQIGRIALIGFVFTFSYISLISCSNSSKTEYYAGTRRACVQKYQRAGYQQWKANKLCNWRFR